VNARAGVVALLAIHWLLAVSSVQKKSTTFDEIAHLTAGVSLWKTGDYRLLPDPPLPHLWAAAPVAMSGFKFPDLDCPEWWSSDHWLLGRRFFYECGNDPQAILVRGRAMIALLSAALGLLVYVWSRRLFGEAGALLSLVLYVFSPTMLAHGRLITSDLSVSLFFLAAMMALWWTLHRVSLLSVLVSALAVTGLLLSKMSALFIVPMAGVLVLIRLISDRPTTVVWRSPRLVSSRARQVGVWLTMGLVQAVMIFLLVWAGYGFRYRAVQDAVPGRDRFYSEIPLAPTDASWNNKLTELGHWGSAIAWAHDHKLLPEPYLVGLVITIRSARTRVAFLNGQASGEGWWSFFPYCFAVKTPLPLLGVLLIAALAAVWRPGGRGQKTGPDRRRSSILDGLYDTAPLWVLLAVYSGFAITSSLNIGHRHMLPIYPAVFILAGGASAWFRSARSAFRFVVPGLGLLFVGSSLMTWPHYLTYFNTLAGGPRNAYHHLVDSSLDWGQDLPGLKTWLDGHPSEQAGVGAGTDAPAVYLSYFGTGLPKFYGIRARVLPGFVAWEPVWTRPLTGGLYCISATLLQQVHLLPECRWTHALEACYQDLRRRLRQAAPSTPSTRPGLARPTTADLELFLKLRFARLCAYLRQRSYTDHVGHTILIYQVEDEEVDRALNGPPSELVAGRIENLRRLGDRCFAARCLSSAVIFYEFLFEREPMSSNPKHVQAASRRGIALMRLGRQQQAVAVMREALAHDPGHVAMNTNVARLLATSRSDQLRDGDEALRRAKLAVAATRGGDPVVLDALAAAHAELGQFDEARRHASGARKMAVEEGRTKLAREIAARLASYERHQPWRGP